MESMFIVVLAIVPLAVLALANEYLLWRNKLKECEERFGVRPKKHPGLRNAQFISHVVPCLHDLALSLQRAYRHERRFLEGIKKNWVTMEPEDATRRLVELRQEIKKRKAEFYRAIRVAKWFWPKTKDSFKYWVSRTS